MRAENGWLKGLNPTVALVSKGVIAVFVLFGVLMTDTASVTFTALKDNIIAAVSWLYIGGVAVALVIVLWLMVSRFGAIKLGRPEDKPEFSLFAWFSMLFAAGMGIGLVFWSVAEPITHLHGTPFSPAIDNERAAEVALRVTYFHWGLHPWAIYALVGMIFAYFGFRRGLPLTVRSALYPLIGDRIYGPIGHGVDILSIFATTFGVATSLGFGAAQINTGLNALFGVEISLGFQLMIVAVITGFAVISVASGLDRGIKLLSEGNLWLSIGLLGFVLVFGPTAYLIESFLQATGDYLQNIVWMSLWTDVNMNRGWQADWTTFYWGWWISWSPFVGMFIARISRGRTIREFLLGVLFVPTVLTFLWLAILGGTALHVELFEGGGIAQAVDEDITLALYAMLERLDPGLLGSLIAGLATLLIATYFITSSDSGTLVVNTILSVGDPNPPVGHRVIWGISEGAVAAILLAAGGLAALQAAAISAALPFSIILIFMTAGFLRAVTQEVPKSPR
ncbi:MAG: BCCT family transporter [Rhodothalassiaceae bacterium]